MGALRNDIGSALQVLGAGFSPQAAQALNNDFAQQQKDAATADQLNKNRAFNIAKLVVNGVREGFIPPVEGQTVLNGLAQKHPELSALASPPVPEAFTNGGQVQPLFQPQPASPSKPQLISKYLPGGKIQQFLLYNDGSLTPIGVPVLDSTQRRINAQTPIGGVNATLPNVHGDTFLKTLDPATAAEVKGLAQGRLRFPAGFALKAPYWQKMLQDVAQYDPTFDAVNYNARAKTRSEFTSGITSRNINALNTVIGHLGYLAQEVNALHNTNYPAVNKVKNFYEVQTGDPRVQRFNTNVKAVVDELTRVYRQAGGSESDIKTWTQQLNAANSPAQLYGVLSKIGDLLESKIHAFQDQYARGMGTTEDNVNFVSPHAQRALDIIRQSGGDTQPQTPVSAPKTAPKPGDIEDGYRFNGGDPSKQANWVKVQ